MVRQPLPAGLILLTMLAAAPAAAQDDPRLFVGALAGVSALSADARSVTTGTDATVSLYGPRNGPAINLFGGVHVAHYVSIQANWMWNRNDLILTGSSTSPRSGGFYEQPRHSHQHAAVLDGLVYFRRRDSAIRPYLGTGLSFIWFSSAVSGPTGGTLRPAPPDSIHSRRLGLRSHVGIDARLSRHLSLRYSFSETISGNPIGEALAPPGTRGLMNFQNLFGIVGRF